MRGDKSPQRMYDEITEVSDEICNAWEIDFLENIGGMLSRGIPLSDERLAKLEQIYAKACASEH